MSSIKYYGIYQGFVKSLKDPEKRGRILCTCPEVLNDAIIGWCEPCVPVAYDNGGDFCLPFLNEGVWIIFIDGDIDRPVYLGGWWCENSTPLGETDSDIRIISYKNATIEMIKDRILLKVDDTELLINSDTVLVNGKELGYTGDSNPITESQIEEAFTEADMLV